MKRLFAIVLALLLATAVLSACGQSANEGATGQPSDAPSSETEASEETGGRQPTLRRPEQTRQEFGSLPPNSKKTAIMT